MSSVLRVHPAEPVLKLDPVAGFTVPKPKQTSRTAGLGPTPTCIRIGAPAPVVRMKMMATYWPCVTLTGPARLIVKNADPVNPPTVSTS